MPPLIIPSQSSDVSCCWMHNFLWALIDFVPAPCLKDAVPSCFLPRVFSSAREKMEPWQNCKANILVAPLKQWSTGANGKMFLPLVLQADNSGKLSTWFSRGCRDVKAALHPTTYLYIGFFSIPATLFPVPWDYHQSQLLAFSSVYQTLLWKNLTKLRQGPQDNLFLCSQVPEPTSITDLSTEISLSEGSFNYPETLV